MNFNKGIKILEKKSFLNNLELLFSAKEKVLNSFKSRLFPIKNRDKIPTRKPAAEPKPEVAIEPAPELAPTKHKKSKLKLQQKFMNEIIAHEKDINNEVFLDYLTYQNPLVSVKDLINAKQNQNEKLLNNINNGLVYFRNKINRKKITEMKIRKK